MSRQGSAQGLATSSSDPGLTRRSSLQNVAATLLGDQTTSLYESMKADGKFRDYCPNVRPSGVSTVVPLADSAARDVQPEIYFAAPATPHKERKYRRLSAAPGEIHVHHGLKEQRLPGDDFRYGIRGIKGQSAEATMKAGQLVGVAEYKNGVKENIYESLRKEPLGKPYKRGHQLQMLPEGFGKPSGEPEGLKNVIFPIAMPRDTEEHRVLYRTTHNNFNPGEKVVRNYNWPEEAKEQWFRFGKDEVRTKEGDGARMALNPGLEDDGNFKQTKIVQRVCEDYRNVEHAQLAKTKHMKQGMHGPPVKPGHAYGIKSTTSEHTAGSCVKGYYNLKEQFPDADLGRCMKPGRRNVTSESRAFGTPSVRTDIPAPEEGRKSIADMMNYGDEFGAAALLNPQRFDDRGVPDQDFLMRRPKEELAILVKASGSTFADIDFDTIWDNALNLFGDGLELVSLDAFLYVYSNHIDKQVHERTAGDALKGSAVERLGLTVA